MKGVIKNLVAERGFGFIRAENGTDYFFHRTGVVPRHSFDHLAEGVEVTFSVETHEKGPRAVDVVRA